MYVFVFLEHIPRSGIAGSYDHSIFKLLKNCQTVFHSGCTILHCHQQRVKVPMPPHPHHLLLIFFLFFNSHSNESKVISHHGFDYISATSVFYLNADVKLSAEILDLEKL